MPELNTDTETLRLFRAIRGAPATILLLLMVRGTSMTGREIALYTGFDNNTITKAKNCLEVLGLLQYNGRLHGWSLRAGSQLLLPFMHPLDESYPQPVDKEIGNSPMIGEFPIYSPSSSSADLTPDLSGSSSRSSNVDRRISDLRDEADGRTDYIHAALTANGIAWNKTTAQLADCDWVTPDYIAAHVSNAPSVGLAIRRMLDGDPAPYPTCNLCGAHHAPSECAYAEVILR